jgi:flagellar protein FliT
MSFITEHYQRLSDITGKMRDAASAGEWDDLIALEKRCAHEVAAIKPGEVVPTGEVERKLKVSLIQKILSDDKAIRERTEPWMRQLEQIMQSARSEQRLQQTYLTQG